MKVYLVLLDQKWEKSDIAELLDAMGQEAFKFKDNKSGICNGDNGKARFKLKSNDNVLSNSEECLWLEFIELTEKEVEDLLSTLHHQLGNPYEFVMFPEQYPKTIFVSFTE